MGFPDSVIHDPGTDWCACTPSGPDRCGYRLLADTIIEHLNPRDGDEAEVSLCMTAVDKAAAYIASQPCTCTPPMLADQEPCPRCDALGLIGGQPW